MNNSVSCKATWTKRLKTKLFTKIKPPDLSPECLKLPMPNQQNPNPAKDQSPISPNLISEIERPYSKTIVQRSNTLLIIAGYLLLIAEIISASLIAFNVKITNDLKEIDATFKEKATLLNDYKDFEAKAIRVSKKIDSFYRIKALNDKKQQKIKIIYDSTPADVQVSSFSLSEGILSLGLRASEGVSFAKFIASYLSNSIVKEISLSSAVYDPVSQGYEFRVDV